MAFFCGYFPFPPSFWWEERGGWRDQVVKLLPIANPKTKKPRPTGQGREGETDRELTRHGPNQTGQRVTERRRRTPRTTDRNRDDRPSPSRPGQNRETKPGRQPAAGHRGRRRGQPQTGDPPRERPGRGTQPNETNRRGRERQPNHRRRRGSDHRPRRRRNRGHHKRGRGAPGRQGGERGGNQHGKTFSTTPLLYLANKV